MGALIRKAFRASALLGALASTTMTTARAGGFHDPRVRLEQELGAKLPLSARFHDERGRNVRLGSYFGSRPVILSLAYLRCPDLCTLVLSGLADSLSRIPGLKLGRDYDVITVSIDPREDPRLALEKKRGYLNHYFRSLLASSQTPIPDAPWHFLTGSQASISAVARAAGFSYIQDPATRQFYHPSGIMVVTPEGSLSRYFYGISYAPSALADSLRLASRHGIGKVAQEILLFCYHCASLTGRYAPLLRLLLRLLGVAVIAGLGWFLSRLIRGEERRKIRREEQLEHSRGRG